MTNRVVVCLLCLAAPCRAAEAPAPRNVLRESYLRMGALLENGAAAEALRLAESSRTRAVEAGRRDYELLFLTGIVNAHSALYNTRDALAAARAAADLARALRKPDSIAAVSGLLADIYTRLGQHDAALSALREALDSGARVAPSVRARLFALAGELRFKSGDRATGLRDFTSAITIADSAGDDASLGDAWDRLGFRLFESGDHADAERAFTEAFRLRQMRGGRGIDISLRNLGMLKVARADGRTAHALLDRAALLVESGRSRIQPWSVYYHRALARRLLGDLEGAVADFARTFKAARRLRADLVPLDQMQSHVDMEFRRFYGEYVKTGMELYARTRSPRIAGEMFLASEENRASGLRQTSAWLAGLPPGYWRLIAELRSAAVSDLAGASPAGRARIRHIEGELTRMESRAGFTTAISSENNPSRSTLHLLQARLRPGEALLSFHLGDSESYVWAVTRHRIEVHSLPGRAALTAEVRAFRESLLGHGNTPGGELFERLFGRLGAGVRGCRDWVLVLDDVLFEAPFAALRDRGRYLLERHTIRVLPSAFMLFDPPAPAPGNGLVAVGDPIYNAADPRRGPALRPLPVAATRGLELARIPASGVEARQCAKQWKSGPAVVLTGPDVTRGRLEKELLRRPAALHMAVHVVSTPDDARALIALGVDATGVPDFLDAFEISRKRYGVPMVVLSGCSSARGRVVSGAGLTGLTRAWLLSGSQAVTASHWATADDTGELFRTFYSAIGRLPRPLSARSCARALRLAQLAMLNSGSWRAQPRYWGAFFVTGRD